MAKLSVNGVSLNSNREHMQVIHACTHFKDKEIEVGAVGRALLGSSRGHGLKGTDSLLLSNHSPDRHPRAQEVKGRECSAGLQDVSL